MPALRAEMANRIELLVSGEMTREAAAEWAVELLHDGYEFDSVVDEGLTIIAGIDERDVGLETAENPLVYMFDFDHLVEFKFKLLVE